MIFNHCVSGGGNKSGLVWHELPLVSTFAPPATVYFSGVMTFEKMPKYIIVASVTEASAYESKQAILIYGENFSDTDISASNLPRIAQPLQSGLAEGVELDGNRIIVKLRSDFTWMYAEIN